jgi:hypothetical protein
MSKKTVKKETETKVKSNTMEQKCYIVMRSGVRVSELVYTSKEEAKTEFDHWSGIVKKWPDGSKIELVEYNETKHRIS